MEARATLRNYMNIGHAYVIFMLIL